MTFIFKKPKLKKKKPRESQEILDRLKRYLDENIEEPIEILDGFWKDQEKAITYQELRQAILNGTLTKEVLIEWSVDYSKLVSSKFRVLEEQWLAAGAIDEPLLQGIKDFKLDLTMPGTKKWLDKRGAQFVTELVQEQREALKVFITDNVVNTHSSYELSHIIRPCIGLNKPQAQANLKLYDKVKQTLRQEHPKMKKETIERRAQEAAVKYAERQHRYRADTIAQSEIAFAYNKGTDEGIRQAQEKNYLGIVEKRWITSGDDNVCDICKALNGVQIPMDEEFDFKGKVLFAGQKLTPPAHPRCACGVQYIEMSPPVIKEGSG